MKTIHSLLTAVILFLTAISAGKAEVQVSVDFFHGHLDPYGDWREVSDYGYVWQPRDVDRDWRPYSDGRWFYTDAGWTWDSEEPYSWAVYHYGRWVRIARVGWVWVPGTEWGPAWVSWRRSERYVGWAPLPPEARFSRDTGFGFGVDVDFDIGPANYRFILARNFGAPRLRRQFIDPLQNITIINQTTNITNITYVNNVVYNQGPRYEEIARQSALPVRRLKLERREDIVSDGGTVRAGQLTTRVDGDKYRVPAPSFDAKPATAPRKVVAKVEKAEVDRGWNNAGPPAEVEKLRKKIKSEPAPSAEPRIPTPAPDKEKDGEKPPKLTAPVRPESVPAAPEKSLPPESPAKPGKKAKPEAGKPQPLPPAKELAEPSIQPKKDTERQTPRPKAKTPPKVKEPGRKPKNESAEPQRKLLPTPARVERIQPEKRPERQDVERVGRDKPESRPKADRHDARKPTPVVEPPAKDEGKKRTKGEEKPDGVPK